MLKNATLLLLVTMSLVTLAPARAEDDDSRLERFQHSLRAQKQIFEFSIAKIILEQNFTDGDMETVIVAKGGDAGLKRFWLFAPDGKLVYEFKSPNNGRNGRNIGAREILVESPEPSDVEIVLRAYPRGIYTFIGESFLGEWLYSQAALSHELPAPATITFPSQDSTVSRYSLTVIWGAVAGAASYVVELKDKNTGRKLEVQIPGNETMFQTPPAWIAPNANYQVEVSVINGAGNVTGTQLTFFTSAN